MAKKKVVTLPTKATVQKHVEKLTKLASKHKGVLPSYTWLNKHGFFRSYEVMRAVPSAFRKIKRARAV
jgi:hypothetical protein